MSTLIYFGAGGDVRPVDLPYNHFIFVDALPNTPHYSHGQNGYPLFKDERAMTNFLETRLGDRVVSVTKTSPNVYVYLLKGDKTLTYFLNTRDEDAHKVPEIASSSIEALLVCGYIPTGVQVDLSALRTVWIVSYLEDEVFSAPWLLPVLRRNEPELVYTLDGEDERREDWEAYVSNQLGDKYPFVTDPQYYATDESSSECG